MSFEMKYDRDGNPIVPKSAEQPVTQEVHQEPEAQAQEEQVEELAPQESDEVQDESIEEEPVQKIARSSKPTPAESFRELKAAKEREERERQRVERERDDYARRLRDYEDRERKPQAKIAEPEEDLSFTINPDDLVEGKHLSKVDKKIKYLENKIDQYERKTTHQTIQNQLRSQYPDFDSVVSQDHLNRLQQTEPELFSTLNSSTDLYSTAVSAYKMIKKLGIAQTEQFTQDVERAQKNAAKPRSVSAVAPQMSDSPLTRANAFAGGLTEDLKKQLHKEMVAASKNM